MKIAPQKLMANRYTGFFVCAFLCTAASLVQAQPSANQTLQSQELNVSVALTQNAALPKPTEFAAHFQTVKDLLERPDDQLDLAEVSLTIHHLIDPSIDIAKNIKRLDEMAKDIKTMSPIMASSMVKLEALKKYLYTSGPWNDNRPFKYDLDDPLGTDIRNKLLPTHLDTRKGNCISMPSLFVILGQKIGLDVTLATAPKHLFVKYRDEEGKVYNIEPTSGGGFARDVWMRQQHDMTDLSLQTGIYMRPLSKREAAVEMVGTLLEFYQAQGVLQPRVDLALLTMQHAPMYVSGMLHLAAAYGWMAEISYMFDYNSPNPRMPAAERYKYKELSQQAMTWGQRAQGLGWQPMSPEAEAAYFKRIEDAKKSL